MDTIHVWERMEELKILKLKKIKIKKKKKRSAISPGAKEKG